MDVCEIHADLTELRYSVVPELGITYSESSYQSPLWYLLY